MGLSKKDETGKLIDKFIERLSSASTGGFLDDAPSGERRRRVMTSTASTFVFIRQACNFTQTFPA